MSKKIISSIIILFLVIVSLYQIFIKKEKPVFNLVEVSRGTISQEVSETGQVKKGEEINLAFKTSGKIERIYVKVGDEIKKGSILAKMDTKGLEIQLQEAKSDLAIYQAKLDKLLAGATTEEIQKAETAVSNDQTSLENAQQNLKDVEAESEENLNAAYEDTLNILDDCYLKIYNAFNTADLIQRTYFTANDQEGIKVRENKEYKIEEPMIRVKSYLDIAKDNPINGNIDTALSEMKDALDKASGALAIIRNICEEPVYCSSVSATDKTSLDTQRTNINTALTNITNSEQTISSTKLTNQSNINTAETGVSTAEGSLKAAQNELALITASPQKTDVDLYEAQVVKAQSQIQYLENQIQESYLNAPVDGQITEIKKRVAEIVSSGNEMIVLLPTDPFQIETDIYEEDVVKINIGNPVDISLVAFPDQIFKGKVIAIDPAEKLTEGVVYYKVTIDFEKIPEGIKTGMTADVVIKTASKENILVIPKEAIQKKDEKIIVQVFRDGKIEDKEIKIGLQGSNDLVEVISGIGEGEKVIKK